MANTNIKKAQRIVDQVDKELGISLVAYTADELEFLRNKLDDLLDLNVDIDELHDFDESDIDLDEEDGDEEEDLDH